MSVTLFITSGWPFSTQVKFNRRDIAWCVEKFKCTANYTTVGYQVCCCEQPEGVTRGVMYVQRNTETRSCNHCCSGKAVSVIYSECVFVALGIQHAKRMRHVILSHLWPVRLYHIFLPLSHKRHDLRKKVTEHKMCVLTSSTNFV